VLVLVIGFFICLARCSAAGDPSYNSSDKKTK